MAVVYGRCVKTYRERKPGMNKEQFLMQLQGHLSVLPPEEYHELMEDYEAHFAFGLQSGKTE